MKIRGWGFLKVFNMFMKKGLEEARITLWAEIICPSSQARVTSAKSSPDLKSLKALLMFWWKFFQLRQSFCEVAILPKFSAKWFENHCPKWDSVIQGQYTEKKTNRTFVFQMFLRLTFTFYAKTWKIKSHHELIYAKFSSVEFSWTLAIFPQPFLCILVRGVYRGGHFHGENSVLPDFSIPRILTLLDCESHSRDGLANI